MSPTLKNSTSAGGAFSVRQLCEPLVLGFLLGVGTTTQAVSAERLRQSLRPHLQTSSGASIGLREHQAPAAIAELRRLTGFTWEQLARLFKVSRRTMHFWVSGHNMTAANEEHLGRVLAAIRATQRGSVGESRAALLALQDDGVTPFEALAEGRYDDAVRRLGRGTPRMAVKMAAVSPATKAARAPRPPEERMNTSYERAPQQPGKVRTGKSVRTESGG